MPESGGISRDCLVSGISRDCLVSGISRDCLVKRNLQVVFSAYD